MHEINKDGHNDGPDGKGYLRLNVDYSQTRTLTENFDFGP